MHQRLQITQYERYTIQNGIKKSHGLYPGGEKSKDISDKGLRHIPTEAIF
jgi:hypothetical protein